VLQLSGAFSNEDAMLTIFAAPKPFRGHIAVIQRNAIRSWTLLRPACEIILLGNEDGIAEIAEEYGLRHVRDIARTAFGTPLVSDLFNKAEQLSARAAFCYVNSDIILMSDFMQAIQRVVGQKKRFLVVGHRSDVDVTKAIDFGQDWEETLRNEARARGRLAGPSSIDFFVFSRGAFGEIPPFVIGRPRWDNWMLYRARTLRVPLIDATPVVVAIHQNHDYSHHPQGKDGTRHGDEALSNAMLAGEKLSMFNIADATHVLTPQKLARRRDRDHLLRYIETLPVLYSWRPLKWLSKAASTSRPIRSRLRLTLHSMRGRPEH
jgi:hypothetical protein